MIEIRGHARGGQGMVTAFEILAKIFAEIDDYQVQAFPAFGVERTGAPIQAFLRVSREKILNRSNIYFPNLVVVFDETLIAQVPVLNGLKKDGAILLNTNSKIEDIKLKTKNIYTIPATQISLDKGLGTKSLPIVNAAMIGAIIKILDIDINVVANIIADNVPTKPKENSESAILATKNILKSKNITDELKKYLNEDSLDENNLDKDIVFKSNNQILDFPSWNKPMSINKTGNWRVVTPKYEEKPPPCSTNCPAGTDVRLFVKQTSEGKFADAFSTIYKFNPFASTCGRVCPHFCQQSCNRIELDSGLNIGAIERFLGDKGITRKFSKSPISKTEKIAVIGSGPAGLTSALRLRQKGYEVIVFEALPYAGGMMRTGIPSFRLPLNILDKEIEAIEEQGVVIKLNNKVTIKELSNDYDIIISAVGSHKSNKMKIPGEEFATDGINFLREFKLENKNYDINIGDDIAIIGGGNTAVDIARTVLRLGAVPTIYYRRSKNEMPAIPHEVEEAINEGVNIKLLTTPISYNKNSNGKIVITLIDMILGEPDKSGRRRPIKIEDSEKIISVNKVFSAIGQTFDDYVFEGKKVKVEQGKIKFENNKPVFCCGDMAWGGTVTEAIGSGNFTTDEVVAFLKNQNYSSKDNPVNVVLPADINYNYYLPTPRHENPVVEMKSFINNFTEVVKGLTEKEVIEESKRCLHCGECYSCGNCYNYCPDAAIHIDELNRLRIDYDYCKGCGICFEECPCSAISLKMDEVVNESSVN
ncbi:MAG: hypothetical protein CO128_06745 [Ignavibacteriales bacterium CG_4_9_14_3_um_filter_30_11]|nr:MAG: hypothetical protein CO128_06745 [Ignavibacteriales bacterium CG_4_9_14_3_um_filter_30_11]